MTTIGKIFLALSLVSFIVFLGVRFFIFDLTTQQYFIPLGIAGLFLLVAVVKDFRVYKDFLFLKTTRHGFNMGTVLLLSFILLFAVNFIAVKNNKTFDLTEEKLFTLADQTQEILSHIEDTLTFKGFFVDDTPSHEQMKAQFRQALRQYRQFSDRIEESYVNPHVEPALAKEYNIDESGGVILEYKSQRSKVESPLEEDITNAIIKVTRSKQKNLYFFKNHGEVDLDASNERGGSTFKGELEAVRYSVNTLDALSSQGSVPESADVLFILGPQMPFLDFEVQMVENYLRQGGKLLLAIDPGVDHNFEAFFNSLGVKFRGDFVIDQLISQFAREVPITAVGIEYAGNHPITEKFKSSGGLMNIGMMSLFFMSSGFEQIDTPHTALQQTDVVKTSPATVSTEELQREAVVSGRGPFVLVKAITGTFNPETTTDETAEDETDEESETDDSSSVTADNEDSGNGDETEDTQTSEESEEGSEDSNEAEAKAFQVVLYGDSDIFTNNHISKLLNKDLVLNTVAALAEDADLISIDRKTPNQTNFKGITRTQYRFFIALAVGLPLLFMILGLIFYLRRRSA